MKRNYRIICYLLLILSFIFNTKKVDALALNDKLSDGQTIIEYNTADNITDTMIRIEGNKIELENFKTDSHRTYVKLADLCVDNICKIINNDIKKIELERNYSNKSNAVYKTVYNDEKNIYSSRLEIPNFMPMDFGDTETPPDVKPLDINEEIYVPLRFVSEALGARVTYEGKKDEFPAMIDIDYYSTLNTDFELQLTDTKNNNKGSIHIAEKNGCYDVLLKHHGVSINNPRVFSSDSKILKVDYNNDTQTNICLNSDMNDKSISFVINYKGVPLIYETRKTDKVVVFGDSVTAGGWYSIAYEGSEEYELLKNKYNNQIKTNDEGKKYIETSWPMFLSLKEGYSNMVNLAISGGTALHAYFGDTTVYSSRNITRRLNYTIDKSSSQYYDSTHAFIMFSFNDLINLAFYSLNKINNGGTKEDIYKEEFLNEYIGTISGKDVPLNKFVSVKDFSGKEDNYNKIEIPNSNGTFNIRWTEIDEFKNQKSSFTYIGGFEYAIKTLLESNPNMKITLMTDTPVYPNSQAYSVGAYFWAQCGTDPTGKYNAHSHTDSKECQFTKDINGNPVNGGRITDAQVDDLYKYQTKIFNDYMKPRLKELAKIYGLEYIDLDGMNFGDENNNKFWEVGDTIHPGSIGNNILANAIHEKTPWFK